MKKLRNIPKLLRVLAVNCAIGVSVGLLFLVGLIVMNIGGIGDLIWRSQNPFLPLALLATGLSVTFGSAAMGAAIMMLPDDDE